MSVSHLKVYRGRRDENGTTSVEVEVVRMSETANGKVKDLSLRLDLARHSPSGFEWGNSGSGPSQLALAILADHLDANPLDRSWARIAGGAGDADPGDKLAMRLHQHFKATVIAGLPREGWELTSTQIHDILVKLADEKQPERFGRDDVV